MTFSTIILLFFIFLFASVVFILTERGKISDKVNPSKTKPKTVIDNKQYYQARDRFFTKSEYMFFQELEKQNNGKYHIFSKVRLEDIVQVIPSLDHKTKRIKRNSIKSRHIDFVLIDKQTGKVTHVIELDGNSHNGSKQKQSDKKKDQILEQSDIILNRVRVGDDFGNRINIILKTDTV